MDETAIDRAAMGRLAQALGFICGADHSSQVAGNRPAKFKEPAPDSFIGNIETAFCE